MKYTNQTHFRYIASFIILIVFTICSLIYADNRNMVLVKGGTFQMGSDQWPALNDQKPVHKVMVSSFYMSKYEVTYDEYDRYCKDVGIGKPGDFGQGRGSMPVRHVNWYDAINYCNWLSKQEGLVPCYKQKDKKVICDFDANGYRLPTEAEWEFAAKGGINKNNYLYAGSNDPKLVSWNLHNSKAPHPVGKKQPNSLGIHDMSGNVNEWCWDYYDYKYYSISPPKDPTGPESGTMRISCGGDYGGAPVHCRVTSRAAKSSNWIDANSGFRIVRSIR